MEQYSARYRGYWIVARLDERWMVNIRPSTSGVQPLPVSTLLMPRAVVAGQVFDQACALVDNCADSHIGEQLSAWLSEMLPA